MKVREKLPIILHATVDKVVELLNKEKYTVTVRSISDKFIRNFTGNDQSYVVTKEKLRKSFFNCLKRNKTVAFLVVDNKGKKKLFD